MLKQWTLELTFSAFDFHCNALTMNSRVNFFSCWWRCEPSQLKLIQLVAGKIVTDTHSLSQTNHTQNSELGTSLSPRKACLYGKGASQRGHGLSHDALLTSLRIHSWVLSKVPVSSLCLSNHCGLLDTSAWWRFGRFESNWNIWMHTKCVKHVLAFCSK